MQPTVRAAAAVALFLGALIAGLVGGNVLAQHSTAGMATVTITSPVGTPSNPQLIGKDGFFTITLATHNFTLDPLHIGSRINKPGSGHYHVNVDSFDPVVPFSRFYVEAGATPTVKISLAALAKVGVTGGTHPIYIVLANNDHSLVKPLAIASTWIRVVQPPVVSGVSINPPLGTSSAPLTPGPDGSFSFSITPHNFILDAAHIGSKINKPGSGHYHVYVDAIDPTSPFKFWLQAGATTDVHVTLNALAKAGVTTGTHTLFVALTNNDHSLIRPLEVAATVIQLGPILHVAEITTPPQMLTLPLSGKITLHISVSNFTLDPADMGKANKPGTGHYHVYIHSFDPRTPFFNYITLGAGPTIDVTGAEVAKLVGTKGGVHALYVVLTNNDHSLVTPITGVSTLINVTG